MDIAAVTIIIQLIFLEGILSIDNAAVLGRWWRTSPTMSRFPGPSRSVF